MKPLYYVYAGVAVVIVLILVAIIWRFHPKRIKQNVITGRWVELQNLCRDKKQWYQAVVDADKLLDDVLKRRRFKGKSTGERLVKAQRKLSNNESVWFGHKLRNRIVTENVKRVSKQDTLEALSGFRQALKDLGALNERGPEQEEE